MKLGLIRSFTKLFQRKLKSLATHKDPLKLSQNILSSLHQTQTTLDTHLTFLKKISFNDSFKFFPEEEVKASILKCLQLINHEEQLQELLVNVVKINSNALHLQALIDWVFGIKITQDKTLFSFLQLLNKAKSNRPEIKSLLLDMTGVNLASMSFYEIYALCSLSKRVNMQINSQLQYKSMFQEKLIQKLNSFRDLQIKESKLIFYLKSLLQIDYLKDYQGFLQALQQIKVHEPTIRTYLFYLLVFYQFQLMAQKQLFGRYFSSFLSLLQEKFDMEAFINIQFEITKRSERIDLWDKCKVKLDWAKLNEKQLSKLFFILKKKRGVTKEEIKEFLDQRFLIPKLQRLYLKPLLTLFDIFTQFKLGSNQFWMALQREIMRYSVQLKESDKIFLLKRVRDNEICSKKFKQMLSGNISSGQYQRRSQRFFQREDRQNRVRQIKKHKNDKKD